MDLPKVRLEVLNPAILNSLDFGSFNYPNYSKYLNYFKQIGTFTSKSNIVRGMKLSLAGYSWHRDNKQIRNHHDIAEAKINSFRLSNETSQTQSLRETDILVQLILQKFSTVAGFVKYKLLPLQHFDDSITYIEFPPPYARPLLPLRSSEDDTGVG